MTYRIIVRDPMGYIIYLDSREIKDKDKDNITYNFRSDETIGTITIEWDK